MLGETSGACTGLILSGGGARAAYQVGVLSVLAELLPPGASNPFPVICGTSAGAINALALATNLPAPSVRDPRRPSRRQRGVMAHVARELERAPWVFTCLPTALRP